MKNLTIDNQEIHLELANGQVWTTSLQIAEIFGKQHKNILRLISNLPADDFNELNFEPVEYTDSKGEPRPYYLISRDGFSLLVMGFTGEKAYKFKIAFIEAFNKMEKELKKFQKESFTTPPQYGLSSQIESLLNTLNKRIDEAEHYKVKYIALLEQENTFLSKTEPLITQKPLDEDTKELLEYAKNIQASKDTINLQDYAKLVNKKGLRVGYHQIYKLLRDKKILSSAKERYNLPYQAYLNKGWFQIQQ